MQSRLGAFVFAIFVAFSTAASAQEALQEPSTGERDTVTIITDGVAGGTAFSTELAGRVAATVDRGGKVRLLPVMGYGAVSGVHDLLYLRGIDLAILNADTLQFLALEKLMPEAESRVRFVTRLPGKTIFLVTREEIASIDELAGKTVIALGERSESHVTARTLFSLLGIKVTLKYADWTEALAALGAGQADAVLMLERNPASLAGRLSVTPGLHLLALPRNAEVAKIYESIRVGANEVPGFIPADGIETLRVPTVLATFAWRPDKGRYAPVNRFVEQLFKSIPAALKADKDSIWSGLDLASPIEGWRRYEPAVEALGKAGKTIEQAAAGAPQAFAAAEQAPLTPLGATVKLLASGEPPLADENLPDGGLVTAIVTASLNGGADKKSGNHQSFRLSWGSDRTEELASLAAGGPYDIGFPWIKPACSAEADAKSEDAKLCAGFLFSEPVFEVLNVLFARKDSGFVFESDESVISKSLCVPSSDGTAALDADGRNWVTQDLITVLKADTIDDCFKMVAAKQADAVFTDDIRGQAALERLGLAGDIAMLDRPVSITRLHMIIARDHPGGTELLEALNDRLRRLKAAGGYYSIVKRQLSLLLGKPITD